MLKAQTVVKALGHSWNNGKVTKAATCTKAGTKTYTCSRCKKTKTETIKATGHKEVKDAAVKATCEKTGKTEGSHCSVCNTVIKAQTVVKATGHKWNYGKITKKATCTTAGIKTYTCTICKKNRTESIPKTGHTKITKFAKKASCTAEGYTGDIYCKVCGELLEKGNVVEQLPHTWSSWNKLSNATVMNPEKQQRTCTVCKTTETRNNGSKLKSVMKVNYSTITLKTKQSTNTLQVSGMNKGDYVASVKSANTGIVKVTKYTKDGKIQLSAQGKAGNTKITICLAGGAVKDIIVKVTIIKTTALKISFRKATIKVGSAKAVKTTVVPANSQEKVTYASSASKVATVTNKGVINAKKRGTAKITVKSGSKTEIITVTVE